MNYTHMHFSQTSYIQFHFVISTRLSYKKLHRNRKMFFTLILLTLGIYSSLYMYLSILASLHWTILPFLSLQFLLRQ